MAAACVVGTAEDNGLGSTRIVHVACSLFKVGLVLNPACESEVNADVESVVANRAPNTAVIDL
jgi:hypothetical protein